MLDQYLRPGVTKPRILKLLHIIGELKAVDFPTLKTVNNPVTDKVATKKLLQAFLTENLIKMTVNDSFGLTVKSLELLKQYKYRTKHLIKDPMPPEGDHAKALTAFLLPCLLTDDHHAVLYNNFELHQLRPDACLISGTKSAYKIQFVEVERTDKDPQYLLKKYDKYTALGNDITTWSGWWKRWAKELDLDYPSKDDFCFSVICKGNKTFEKEGWEWTTN